MYRCERLDENVRSMTYPVSCWLVAVTLLFGMARLAANSEPAFSIGTTPAITGAGPLRSCGDIPEKVPKHLAIHNVTTRGLRCPRARRAAIRLYHCAEEQPCLAAGLRFRCRNLGRGETVDERCVAGQVVVRFQTGV